MVSEYFYGNSQTLKVVESDSASASLAEWVVENEKIIDEQLLTHGAILFRNFSTDCIAAFRDVVKLVSPELEDVYEVPTPRTKMSGHVYTSTNYPPEETIPLHNELSHTLIWPMKLWFYCKHPAATGGQTPIADSRLVYNKIDASVRDKFIEKELCYIRNFSSEKGELLSWKDVYRSKNKEEVMEYCQANRIDFEWLGENQLRTSRNRTAIECHPITNEAVWFNQAHIFHNSNMEKDLSDFITNIYGENTAMSPYDTTYGDGSPITREELDHVREVLNDSEIVFDWKANDVMLLDNVLCMHGRKPYSGKRQVLVSMAQKYVHSEQSDLLKEAI